MLPRDFVISPLPYHSPVPLASHCNSLKGKTAARPRPTAAADRAVQLEAAAARERRAQVVCLRQGTTVRRRGFGLVAALRLFYFL